MKRSFHSWLMAALATGLPVPASLVQAFPPGPYHTIFGNVRDQYGKLLPSTGTVVRVFAGSTELPPQPLLDVPSGNYNYQIRLRMDMARPDTNPYHPQVLNKDSALSLKVEMGGRTYLPIEMKHPTVVGEAAARRRLDLTLGVDRDDDGLPDAWEESQLYQAGEPAGQDGWDLSKLDRDGDQDGDGFSNWQEYISGTYAVDATSILDLRILEKTDSLARLEFYSFYGKGYTLEASTDLKTWTPVSFTLAPPSAEGAGAEALASLTANTTGPTSLYVVTTGPTLHYRLLAR